MEKTSDTLRKKGKREVESAFWSCLGKLNQCAFYKYANLASLDILKRTREQLQQGTECSSGSEYSYNHRKGVFYKDFIVFIRRVLVRN